MENQKQQQVSISDIEVRIQRNIQALGNDVTFLMDQLRLQATKVQEQTDEIKKLIVEIDELKKPKSEKKPIEK